MVICYFGLCMYACILLYSIIGAIHVRIYIGKHMR